MLPSWSLPLSATGSQAAQMPTSGPLLVPESSPPPPVPSSPAVRCCCQLPLRPAPAALLRHWCAPRRCCTCPPAWLICWGFCSSSGRLLQQCRGSRHNHNTVSTCAVNASKPSAVSNINHLLIVETHALHACTIPADSLSRASIVQHPAKAPCRHKPTHLTANCSASLARSTPWSLQQAAAAAFMHQSPPTT